MTRSTQFAQYPKLGQIVDFVVTDQKTGALIEATGRVLAICMDGRKRVMAHLAYVPADDRPEVNVDLQCLNPSAEFKAQLTAVLEQVLKNSADGNEAVKAIVEKHNATNDALFDSLLGSVVEFEELPEQEIKEAA